MFNNKQKNYNKIIILGNGFDLACGLKSTYKDFFNWRLKQLSKTSIFNKQFKKVNQAKLNQYCVLDQIESIKEEIKVAEDFLDLLIDEYSSSDEVSLQKFFPKDIKDFNYWDLIFLFNQGQGENWYNIESIMAKYLKDIFINKLFNNLPNSSNYQKLCRILYVGEKTTPKMQAFLSNQLKIFEDNFADYIKEQVCKNRKFEISARKRLAKIINDYKTKAMEVTVLTFNYSLSDQDDLKDNFHHILPKWINIHGSCNYLNNSSEYRPIFGIDSSSLKTEDDPRNIFTKTYQIALNSIERKEIQLPKNAYCISFYGHSLSQADYSYFESIFDMYNLYSSNTYLCFYCGIYNTKGEYNDRYKTKNNKIKQEFMTSIYKLIQHYGSTLSRNHGDNLFHRLILEGRIKIELDPGARSSKTSISAN